MSNHPKRGEVWWVTFDASIGGEIQKTRPAVIVSNNISNKHLNRVQLVPLTTNTKKFYPAECSVQVGDIPGKAIASQVTTASKERLRGLLANVSEAEMEAIEKSLKIQLGL